VIGLGEGKERPAEGIPKGPIRFVLRHLPSGRVLGIYPTSTEVRAAKERAEREDPEGAARGDYRASYTFDPPLPRVEPHRFELALLDGSFGPICSACGLPAVLGPHTDLEEALRLMEDF